MDLFQAIVLGIFQGLTEFLPISSTAHLRIVPALLGWPDPGAPFTAVTQIGTLLAVLFTFRKDVLRLFAAFIRALLHRRPFESNDAALAWWIIAGTIPIVVCGMLFKSSIEHAFRSLYVISASLIILAGLLALAERISRRARTMEHVRFSDVLAIGAAQAVALVPGASRSGTTITAGLFLHFTRETSAAFSFLLSIPAIALSGLYQLYELRHQLLGERGLPLIVATVVSAIVGFLTIEMLLRFLRTHSTFLFIWYRLALGIVLLILLSLGILPP
ncbi:MAG: undecaprenyl-diphosphatase UppP [Bacteroidota bacterium]|nr:undecaprenyl-diphosphatase UppP [Bacteroidota bacterium]